MSKSSIVAPAKVEGKVNDSLLVDYQNHVIEVGTSEQEAEIAYMRESVASGLSVRDQEDTLKAGQEWARANGKRVLPSLTSGKVQVFAQALTILDTASGSDMLTVKELLNLAWNARRLPEGFEIEGATVEGIADSIPAREVKGNSDKPKVERKSTRAIPTLPQLVEIVEQVKESLPEDPKDLSELDVLAVAKIAKSFAELSRWIKRAA